mgnify:FL=1
MNPHLAQMKLRLEEVLDEYFPKIYEEGPEKIAVKRGAALMLYGEAMVLAQKAIEDSTTEIINALESMYDQYCNDGHSFMSAGENASSILARYGFKFDGGGAITKRPTI